MNVGVHLDFMPEVDDPRRMEPADCPMWMRLRPDDSTAPWDHWFLIEDGAERARELIDKYASQARPFLDRYKEFPKPFDDVSLEDLEKPHFLETFSEESERFQMLLLLTLLNERIGRPGKAVMFAERGLHEAGEKAIILRQWYREIITRLKQQLASNAR